MVASGAVRARARARGGEAELAEFDDLGRRDRPLDVAGLTLPQE